MQRRFPRQKVSVSPLWIRNAVHGVGFHDCDRCRLVIAGGTLTFCAAGHPLDGGRFETFCLPIRCSIFLALSGGMRPKSFEQRRLCGLKRVRESKRHSFLYTQACGAARRRRVG